MSTHMAALCVEKGQPLTVQQRQTPDPGRDEVLVDVKSVAINLVDSYMRNFGHFLTRYPAVLGSDVSGTILKVGPGVDGTFAPGTRVTAFASSFYRGTDPDFGAFQHHVLVPASSLALIPKNISFNEAAVLPMAVAVTMAAWTTLGLSIDTKHSPADKQGLLVWGASTSMGTIAVQTAKLIGFTVLATASPENHDYIKSLGVDKVFDYNDTDVVETMTKVVASEGLTVRHCFFARGNLDLCQKVITKVKGEGTGIIAHAPPLLPGTPVMDGIEVQFIQLPTDPEIRNKQLSLWFNSWLTRQLRQGLLKPSPKVQLMGKGLQDIDKALDLAFQGIDSASKGAKCAKFVVQLQD